MTVKSIRLSAIPAVAMAAAAFLPTAPAAFASHEAAQPQAPQAEQPGPPAQPQAPVSEQQGPPAEPPPVQISPSTPMFLADGFYFGMGLGAGIAPDFSTDADFDVGADWVDGLELTAGFRAGIIRLEAEFGIQSIQVSSLKLGVASPFPIDDYAGSMLSGNLMANLYVESPLALFGRARPYLGWGRGFSAVHAQYTQAVCSLGVCSPDGDNVVNDGDMAKSRQFMVGATISDDPTDVEFFFEYRFLETRDLKFRTVGKVDFIQEGMQSHMIQIGVRMKL